jgi:hypothetical protein
MVATAQVTNDPSLPKEKFHLYLLVGQSNMAGRGVIEPEDTIGNPRILVLNLQGKWQIAKNPLHSDRSTSGVGPGLTFAREMVKDDDDIVIGLIPCAVGSSNIDVWKAGAYFSKLKVYPYDDMMTKTKRAMQDGVLKGILWHQGEADCTPDKVASYKDKLIRLVASLREEFHTPDVPFIAGELPDFKGPIEDVTGFNRVIHEAKNDIRYYDVVTANDLKAKPDRVHINSASQREFGKRYAEKMKSQLYACQSDFSKEKIDSLPDRRSLTGEIAELCRMVEQAGPDDTIVLKNGTYSDAQIVLHAVGTDGHSVVVMAETAGKVFIEGISMLRISGEYLEVSGFVFRNGYSAADGSVCSFKTKKGVADNCRITDCTIIGFNHPEATLETVLKTTKEQPDANSKKDRWVTFYGQNNRVDHCKFDNKTTFASLIKVQTSETPNRHRIDHNYFGHYISLQGYNGGEVMMIGGLMTESSQTVVEENYFESCDGESEIISLKSSDNIVRHNFFIECVGGVVCRAGIRNLVENNVFIGNGKKDSGGIRIIGFGHTVRNNYLEGQKGSDYCSALCLMNGMIPPAQGYLPVKDVLIENNIWIDCEDILFNLCNAMYVASAIWTPENVTFRSNIFYRSKFRFLEGAAGVRGIDFKKNILDRDILPKEISGFTVKTKMRKPQRPVCKFKYGTTYQLEQ